MVLGRYRLPYIGAAIAMVAGAVLGLADPHGALGSSAWCVAAMGVLWGFGATIERKLEIPFTPGERLLFGGAVWLFVVGFLLAAGVASRVPLLCVAAIGLVLAIYDLVRRSISWVEPAPRTNTIDVAYIVLGSAFALFLIVNLIGLVTSRGNPSDDHVAYTAFVKRLLDCGDLVEPFSIRRISAYGGQTVLHSLVAIRGDVESTELLDLGIFQIITYLLVFDLAARRKLHPGVTTIIVVFLACLSDLSINSASTWTGLAAFLGAYSVASNEARKPREALLLTFFICAIACTLRQNYLLPAGGFAALLLVFHVKAIAKAGSTWRAAIKAERRTILWTIGLAAIVLLPYMVATWRSNQTFLYPVLLGNANPAGPLQPSGFTLLDELSFLVNVFVDSEPIRVWWILGPFMLLAKDARKLRPWYALLIASVLGFVFLVHSFTLSDAGNLWRYAFAYMTALVIIFLIEAAGKIPAIEKDDQPAPPLRAPAIAVLFVWLAILTQLVQGRQIPGKRVKLLIDNFKIALVQGTDRLGVYDIYEDMQRTLPEGARVAIMVDNAHLLDYSRNELFNLDLPGFVAPAPGLPSFLGPERWRSYFTSQGIRYLAFMDDHYSAYLYRRRGWLQWMFSDMELYRYLGAHIVDTNDALQKLAKTSRVLFHRDGLYAIDLGEPVPETATIDDPPETVRQDAFVRNVSETELGDRTWELSSRRDVIFQIDSQGPAPLAFEVLDYPDGYVGGVMKFVYGDKPREPARRYLADKTHVRLYGSGTHRLRVKLHAELSRLGTTPTATVRVDGELVGRAMAGPDGYIVIEGPVSCTGWCDMYIVFSTMSEFWQHAANLRALSLFELGWTKP